MCIIVRIVVRTHSCKLRHFSLIALAKTLAVKEGLNPLQGTLTFLSPAMVATDFDPWEQIFLRRILRQMPQKSADKNSEKEHTP